MPSGQKDTHPPPKAIGHCLGTRYKWARVAGSELISHPEGFHQVPHLPRVFFEPVLFGKPVYANCALDLLSQRMIGEFLYKSLVRVCKFLK